MKNKPIHGGLIEVSTTWEEEREEGLDPFLWKITGWASPIVPARTSGRPDDWYPAEGGEIEDMQAVCEYANATLTLPYELMENRFGEKVIEEILTDLGDQIEEQQRYIDHSDDCYERDC